MTGSFVGVAADYAGAGGAASAAFQNADNTMPTVTSGQMLIVVIGWGNQDGAIPSAPGGWTYMSTYYGGAGSFNAEDSGQRGISFWYRRADGTENGNTYTWSSPSTNTTGRVIWGYCFRFAKTLSYWENPELTGGADNTSGGTYSALLTSNPGATTGDIFLVAGATLIAATNPTWACSWPGVNGGSTTTTSAKTGQATSGYNVRVNASYKQVTSGTSSGAPTVTSTSDIIGPVGLIRLRDTNTAPNNPPVADAGADQTAEPFARFTLDGSASTDPDDDITDYLWEDITVGGTGTVVIDDPTAAVTSAYVVPTEVADEDYTFRLTVTDAEAEEDTDTCVVTVYRAAESCYRSGVLVPVRIISA